MHLAGEINGRKCLRRVKQYVTWTRKKGNVLKQKRAGKKKQKLEVRVEWNDMLGAKGEWKDLKGGKKNEEEAELFVDVQRKM